MIKSLWAEMCVIAPPPLSLPHPNNQTVSYSLQTSVGWNIVFHSFKFVTFLCRYHGAMWAAVTDTPLYFTNLYLLEFHKFLRSLYYRKLAKEAAKAKAT